MKLETFLTTYTHNSESIIQWIFLAVLVMVGFLIARGLFGKKEAVVTASSSAGASPVAAAPSLELQAVLDKIMAQTAKLESVQLSGLAPAGVAEIDAQVQALKTELSSRETEISALKASGAATAGPVAADAGDLAGRIKELEAKLAEYEILEDDIADLSLYKEENTRLKTELEKIRTAPAAAAVGEAIVEEFAQAVAVPAPEAPAAPPLDVPDTGNPMQDFESTLAAVAPAPAAVSAQAEADDLFAEFSQEDKSTLDTDKMMAEMAALVSIEPSTGNALDESIDIEKMASEAGNKS